MILICQGNFFLPVSLFEGYIYKIRKILHLLKKIIHGTKEIVFEKDTVQVKKMQGES